MTVILAMRESDESLLLASDGAWTEHTPQGTIRSPFSGPKLYQIGKLPLAIGTSSDQGQFAKSFVDLLQTVPMGDWDGLKRAARAIHARLHGDVKGLYELARKDFTPTNEMDGLLVGWIAGTPDIVEFQNPGKTDSYLEEGFHAIGGGSGYADVVYQALKGITMTPLERLHRIVDTLIYSVPLIGEPKTIWRITPKGIEPL